MSTTHVIVAEVDGRVVGMAQLSVFQGEADLLKLFVDPLALRGGIGSSLMGWSCDTAKRLGAKRLVIDADPHAAEFYRRMGATDIGLIPSGSIPRRMLPQLVLDLRQ